MQGQINVGVLVSGGGSNLQAIIDACRTGQIDARVVFVGSDNPAAGGLKRAQKYQIPGFVIDYKALISQYKRRRQAMAPPPDCDWQKLLEHQRLLPIDKPPQQLRSFFIPRLHAEAHLLAHMQAYPVDLLVLAGFMRTLTPYFINRFNTDPQRPRIMNIHPSLLPAFAGVDGYGDTFRYGCRVGGCTVHFIDYGEDTGPIIGQRAFAIAPDDTLETVRERGLALEWELYPHCIQLYAEDRLKVMEREYDLGGGKRVCRRVVQIQPKKRKRTSG